MSGSKSIPLKKRFGQHFLRNHRITQVMLNAVKLTKNSSVFEIGCGDGFLTKAILQTPITRLWTFEIDLDWAEYVRKTIIDPRLRVIKQNFLDIDFVILQEHQPWTVLSNLPYQVTFPILYLLQKHCHLLKEGVIMVQEEVAQKITKSKGRGYGFPTLFFQRFFMWKMLEKIPPSAFHPPPKVFSRLLYFKPIIHPEPIEDEDAFWDFIKVCFRQPRRTLRNNLLQAHYPIEKIPKKMLDLRAQQLSMNNFLGLWRLVT